MDGRIPVKNKLTLRDSRSALVLILFLKFVSGFFVQLSCFVVHRRHSQVLALMLVPTLVSVSLD